MDLKSVYTPKEVEEEIYKFWLQEKIFNAKVNREKIPYTIVMPPPNVTGSLHLGHAFDSTIQDIMIRFKKMKGFETLWLPGVDHAGIATQLMVERELLKSGIKKDELGREEFLKKVWEWKEKYGDRIVDQQKRLGIAADWERHRFTMDERYQKAVLEAFVRLYNDGKIYRGEYMINWCPKCHTALSDLEVEYREEETKLYYIKYPFENDEGSIIVATTRPETMLGDTAVAVHPDDKRYKNYVGKFVILPLVGRRIPVISDEKVDMEFGTGAVKVTPAHDSTDFEIGERHNLPKINIFTPDAIVNENGGKFKGLTREEARKKIVKELEEKNYLVKIEDYVHSIGVHDRCKTVIEPMISKQWFIKMKPLAEEGLRIVRNGGVKIIPERWTKVYEDWLTNIKDWCISRQIWWGHRIPIYYCKQCGEITASTSEIDKCPKCGGEVERDPDVLDTWFSSGLWPFATLGWPEDTEDLRYFYPTSLLVTGYDILFFWVARMIMFGMYFMKKEPFKHVYLHGLIRDEKGKKMSKTLGNVIDPLDLLDKYGADATRYTFALLSTVGGQDINFSEGRVKFARNFMNKIWNAGRFVINTLEGFNPEEVKSPEFKREDIWILKRLSKMAEKANEVIENYEFGEIANSLYEFFWHEFCDWYIEISKLREDETAKLVLFTVFSNSLKLLHPFVPFITEKLFRLLPVKEKSIMLSSYPSSDEFPRDEEIENEFKEFMEITRSIRNLKSVLNIPVRKKESVFIRFSNEKLKYWKKYIEYLSSSEITSEEREELKRISDAVMGNEIYLYLSAEFPIDESIKRIKKNIDKLEREINTLNSRLSSPSFKSKAPKHVIEETELKMREDMDTLSLLKKYLKELEG